MAGRPLGALTIAVLVAVLTSRIAPGDARFFVLQVGEAGGWGLGQAFETRPADVPSGGERRLNLSKKMALKQTHTIW